MTFSLHGNESRNSSPVHPSMEENTPNRKLQPHLPPKPISLKEENMKKGYFPVSWRVIGGGVPLGSNANDKRRPLVISFIIIPWC